MNLKERQAVRLPFLLSFFIIIVTFAKEFIMDPSMGVVHTATFKYASILLKMDLCAESEVFMLDAKKADKLSRAFTGFHIASKIIIMSDNPNINLVIGHELGHNALDKAYPRKIRSTGKQGDICEETFCDLCGLEYWMTKNQQVLEDNAFIQLLDSELQYIKNTWLAVGMEKENIIKGLESYKLRLCRAWEWLQYAIYLEKEGKISNLL